MAASFNLKKLDRKQKGKALCCKWNKIITSIESLSEQEFAKLRDWITERDWEKWDRQIEKDSKDGKLDFLVAEAINAKQNGRLRQL
jgi:hypothetical protein